MKLNQVKITKEIVTLNGDIILIDVRSLAEYVDGKRTDNIVGHAYICVAPANKYTQFSVKIEGKKPVISNEELEANGGSVMIDVVEFEGRFYQNANKDVLFTAKASKIEVIG